MQKPGRKILFVRCNTDVFGDKFVHYGTPDRVLPEFLTVEYIGSPLVSAISFNIRADVTIFLISLKPSNGIASSNVVIVREKPKREELTIRRIFAVMT